MPGLDHNGIYVVSAFAITVVVLAAYTAYLWSRLTGLRRRRAGGDHSARNVTTAAPMVTTAQPASNASGSTRS